jgi:hypothetical protein
MRICLVIGAIAGVLLAWPAHACLELASPRSEARAFKRADLVVRVETLTANYLPVPGVGDLRVGVATGRVVESLKGGVKKGSVIPYRVVEGEGGEGTCPARRGTGPGGIYKLYLKHVPDWGPPVIILPTDY